MDTEILEGEIVEDDSPSGSVVSRRKREAILGSVRQGENLTTACKLARIPANTFISNHHRALSNPKHPDHKLALEIEHARGTYESELRQKVVKLAEDKGKWEGIMTLLERQFSDEWRRPSQAAATNVLQIGTVERLALLQQQNGGELPAGD